MVLGVPHKSSQPTPPADATAGTGTATGSVATGGGAAGVDDELRLTLIVEGLAVIICGGIRSNLDTVAGSRSVGINLGETHIEIVLVISHTCHTNHLEDHPSTIGYAVNLAMVSLSPQDLGW